VSQPGVIFTCCLLYGVHFVLHCRVEGPDAKKTACYDIDVEVVSIVQLYFKFLKSCRSFFKMTVPLLLQLLLCNLDVMKNPILTVAQE